MVVAFLASLGDPAYVQELADRKLTAFSMDAIPRITRRNLWMPFRLSPTSLGTRPSFWPRTHFRNSFQC